VAVNFHQHAEEAGAVCAEIERLDRRALAVEANVVSAAEVAQMVEGVERQLGGTDILVNHAGIMLASNGCITGPTINAKGGWYMS